MHSAPSVEYPAGRPALQARFELGLALAWLAMQLAWWFSLQDTVLPGAWWFSGLLGLLVWLATRWLARSTVQGRLRWEPSLRRATGGPNPPAQLPGRWIWSSAAYRHGTELAALSWSLDLQHHVLLHLRNAAGLGWWVWLARDAAPDDWHALRVALVAWREAGCRVIHPSR